MKCHSSSHDNNGEDGNSTSGHSPSLGQTVILVQQGNEIQELPVIMRKFGQNEVGSLCANAMTVDGVSNSSNAHFKSTRELFTQQSKEEDCSGPATVNPAIDPDNVIHRLDNCVSSKELFQVIESVPEDELAPEIVVSALEKLMRTETIDGLKQLEEANKTYSKLIRNLCKKAGNNTLLESLGQFSNYLRMESTIDKICNELLIRSADGCLSIIEICESISAFITVKHFADAEKFWSGISDKESEINTTNIKFVYEILPKVKISRRMILGVLERRIIDIYSQLAPDAVCKILNALKECNSPQSFRAFRSISAWLTLNIQNVTECQLESIINSFTTLGFTDQQFEKSLDRYTRAKATKIKSQTLIVEILQHILKFRILNPYILNGCSEYIIMNSELINPGYLRDLVYPFGYLNYQPLNSVQFWKTVEKLLEKHFDKLSPRHVMDIMLSCVYLEVYPNNFVDRIFNPYFLDLVHSQTTMSQLHAIRSDLKIFDTALSLECGDYAGPMLPRDTTVRPMWTDNRIKRIVNDISDSLVAIADGEDRFTKMTVSQQLPYTPIYIIDVLFHPPGLGRFWNFNAFLDRNVYVAAVIHLPEHYDRLGHYLIGPQIMRIRHLRAIGFKVVSFKYETLAKLRVHPTELHEYMVKRMREALPAKA